MNKQIILATCALTIGTGIVGASELPSPKPPAVAGTKGSTLPPSFLEPRDPHLSEPPFGGSPSPSNSSRPLDQVDQEQNDMETYHSKAATIKGEFYEALNKRSSSEVLLKIYRSGIKIEQEFKQEGNQLVKPLWNLSDRESTVVEEILFAGAVEIINKAKPEEICRELAEWFNSGELLYREDPNFQAIDTHSQGIMINSCKNLFSNPKVNHTALGVSLYLRLREYIVACAKSSDLDRFSKIAAIVKNAVQFPSITKIYIESMRDSLIYEIFLDAVRTFDLALNEKLNPEQLSVCIEAWNQFYQDNNVKKIYTLEETLPDGSTREILDGGIVTKINFKIKEMQVNKSIADYAKSSDLDRFSKIAAIIKDAIQSPHATFTYLGERDSLKDRIFSKAVAIFNQAIHNPQLNPEELNACAEAWNQFYQDNNLKKLLTYTVKETLPNGRTRAILVYGNSSNNRTIDEINRKIQEINASRMQKRK